MKFQPLLKEVKQRIFWISNNIIFGLFILEISFNKGLFSNNINTLSDLILYLIWAIIISLPFNYFSARKLNYIAMEVKIQTKEIANDMGLGEKYRNLANRDQMQDHQEAVESPFNIISIGLYYIINKVLVWKSIYFFESEIISPNIERFIYSLIAVLLLRLIIVFPYRKVIIWHNNRHTRYYFNIEKNMEYLEESE